MNFVLSRNRGFSLVELMIAMTIAIIVGAVIFQFFIEQEKHQVSQNLSVEMQQNLRAAIAYIKREIRMAGYDPAAFDGIDNDGINGVDDVGEAAGAGIQIAGGSLFRFSLDKNGNGEHDDDADEIITYGFSADDSDGDGVADSGATSLVRQDAEGSPATAEIAYDIQAVAFAYAFDEDLDGELDTSPGGHVIWAFDSDGDGFLDTVVDTNDDGVMDAADSPGGSALTDVPFSLPSDVNINRIRSVRIWLLARTRYPIQGYSDTRTYVVGARRVTAADAYQRCLVIDTVYCRNLGL